MSAADATLFHDDLRVIPWAIEISREALRAVRRSLGHALVYNLIGMTLAACGVLHPVVAVVLMVVSSLSLVFSATRLGVYPNRCHAPANRGNQHSFASRCSRLLGMPSPSRCKASCFRCSSIRRARLRYCSSSASGSSDCLSRTSGAEGPSPLPRYGHRNVVVRQSRHVARLVGRQRLCRTRQ